jgi:hypothetical protein
MNLQEIWKPHKWRRDTSWWDTFEVPDDVVKEPHNIFAWVEENAPDPSEHDFILYTDGSGCDRGWGGWGAVLQRVSLVGDTRQITSSECLFAGTYGSTVQRSEMNAFLEGIHRVLHTRAEEIREEAIIDDTLRYEIGRDGILHKLTGPDRPTVLWYTDRANLAKSLLFGEDGDVLNSRSTETDLWMRWSAMARHVCVTPLATPRNTVDGQTACDSLAGLAREILKNNLQTFAEKARSFQTEQQWNNHKPQRAQF